jgi:hypothetical protein
MAKQFSLSSVSLSDIAPLLHLFCEVIDSNECEIDSPILNATIRICGTDFSVPKSVLTFVSPFALAEASNHSNVFAIDCPSNSFGVTPSTLVQLFQRLLSLFASNEAFSFEESDYSSMKYLFTELKSDCLIQSFNRSFEDANGPN